MSAENLEDMTAGQGQRLLRRAMDPGVIHPIQRRPFPRENGLAAEIKRRWASESTDGGHGSALPYFRFGRFGAEADAGSGILKPVAAATRAMPTARTMGTAAVSPAAQALSALGSSLQRRHLGGTRARLGVPGDPENRLRRDPHPQTPTPTRTHTRPGEGTGVRVPTIQRMAKSAAEAPAGPDRDSAATAPRWSIQPVAAVGPAIVQRAAGRGNVQHASFLPPAKLTSAGSANSAQDAWNIPIGRISPAGRISPIEQNQIGPIARIDETAASLPLVQPRRLMEAGNRAKTVQLRKIAGAPVQRRSASPEPAGELPLALPTAVIQRQTGKALEGMPAEALQAAAGTATAAVTSGTESLIGVHGGTVQPVPAEKIDLEEVVERVMRRLKRSLAAESERHGGRRWP